MLSTANLPRTVFREWIYSKTSDYCCHLRDPVFGFVSVKEVCLNNQNSLGVEQMTSFFASN